MSDDVLELLDSLDKDTKTPRKSSKQPSKETDKDTKRGAQKSTKKTDDEDILGFLDDLEPSKDSKLTKDKKGTKKDSKDLTTETTQRTKGTPPTQPTEPSHSTDSMDTTKLHTAESKEVKENKESKTPSDKDSDNTVRIELPDLGLSSWWNKGREGLLSAATRATEAVKDIQQEQHFNLGAIGNRITSVLNTIVPPISRHEQLNINIFHDMVGYPNIDRQLHEVFERVMDQVEGGGDMNLVVQKGEERRKAGSDWEVRRSLNYARCSLDSGAKLALASIEDYRRSNIPQKEQSHQNQDKKQQPQQQPQEQAPQGNSQDRRKHTQPDIRVSELYVSIQPVLTPSNKQSESGEVLISADNSALYFVVYLADYDHHIKLVTASQPFPAEWAEWLDSDTNQFEDAAIDPREWVSGWVSDGLSLAFGILAQKYVTTRMGVTPPPVALK